MVALAEVTPSALRPVLQAPIAVAQYELASVLKLKAADLLPEAKVQKPVLRAESPVAVLWFKAKEFAPVASATYPIATEKLFVALQLFPKAID